MASSAVDFYFDPICPFAWMTSKWVRQVASRQAMEVDWRFISLRLVNAGVDYDTHFPAGYEAGHTAGLRSLRVAAAVREQHGRPAVGRFYEALGGELFDVEPGRQRHLEQDCRSFLEPILERIGLPAALAARADDSSLDGVIQAETDRALALTGRDVGTPILHIAPPEGSAFFGPVISRLPDADSSVRLWDHIVGLATFPGFAELKRSLRELPQLRGLGVTDEQVGPEQDWEQGRRRSAPGQESA